MNPPYFLFDIGASHTRIGLSFDGETLANTEIYPTPQSYVEGLNIIEQKAKNLIDGQLGGLVGGIAGPLNESHSMIVGAPNLPDWNNKPLVEDLERRISTKVFLENDTALVGLGEAVGGAGMGFGIVAYMTISTGVNGVLIVDQKIAPNRFGFEIGEQIVDLDKSYDNGSRTFEDLVAGSQFERRHGKKSYDISDPSIWEEEARLIAYGVNNMILFWSPDVVVLGGGVMKQVSLERVVSCLEQNLTIFPVLPQIKKAKLQDFGGLAGALHLTKSLR